MHPLGGAAEFSGGLMVLSDGLAIAYILVALEIFLAYAYGAAFRGLLNPFAKSRWHEKEGRA